jgi:hypothetical protein
MLTQIWGPPLWHFLHTMSFNYPVNPTQEDKINYSNFVLSLKHVLPCGKCRNNLSKNLKRLPLKMKDMNSRDSFSRWVYKIHEVVNKMLKKKSGLSYEDVRERYEHFRARCVQPLSEMETELENINENLKKLSKSEIGCIEPLYGEKSKCVLHIVPQTKKCRSLEIDNKCLKKKIIIEKQFA